MKRIFEILSMVALLVWGGVFLYFFFSGRVNDYLNSSFRIWVPIAGTGMIALGALNLINRNRDTGACSHDHVHGDHSQCDHDHHDHDHHDHKDCEHDHEHEETCAHEHHHEHDEKCEHDHHHEHDETCDHDHHRHDHPVEEHHHHDEATASSLAFALVVLLVPLLTAANFSQDSFSGDYTKKWAEIERKMQSMRLRKAAEARQLAEGKNPYTDPEGTGSTTDPDGGEAWGEFTLEDLKKMVPQTSAGDFLLDVPQIFYTAGDQELMTVMEGISIETIAQVIEETVEGAPSNRLRAYRLLIECCAADARPLSIPIDFAEAVPEYKEMGWYKLIGRLHFHEGGDHEYVPILQIKSFQPTPEPADWMSY